MTSHAITSAAVRWLAVAGAAGAFVTGLSVRATSGDDTARSSHHRVQAAVSDSVAAVPVTVRKLRVVAVPGLKLPKPKKPATPATPPTPIAPATPPPTLVTSPAPAPPPAAPAPRPAPQPSAPERGPVFDSSG